MKAGIIAALPGELKPLVRGWRGGAAKDGVRRWIRNAGADTLIAVCAGMGADAVRRAVAAAEADGPLDLVLSVGWAGALVPEPRPGDARVLSVVIDAQTGEQFQLTAGEAGLTLVTTGRVANATEKAGLRAAYTGAVMVDMEGATAARMAQMRGIPAACIKGVSDGLFADLPDLNRFLSARGQLRTVPFLAYLVLRPRYWRSVAELGRNSSKAAQAIRDLVLEFIEQQKTDRLGRTETGLRG
jgi:adenosylhomocysteine nucleosidase